MNKMEDLLIFTQPTCSPCKIIVPKATEYATQAGITYKVIDVNSPNPEDHRLSDNIHWTPTLILHGKEVQIEDLENIAKAGRQR